MVEGEHMIDSRRIAVTDKEVQKLLKVIPVKTIFFCGWTDGYQGQSYHSSLNLWTCFYLLQLPTLQAKLSGVLNLVNFVTKCLHVDPDLRPAAKDLLKDPFLY